MSAFDDWLALALAEQGRPFTAHAVLLRDAPDGLVPLCGTWVELDEAADWGAMLIAFAGAGLPWDVVAFFPADGLMDNPAAHARMQALQAELDAEPRLLGAAALFGPEGERRLNA